MTFQGGSVSTKTELTQAEVCDFFEYRNGMMIWIKKTRANATNPIVGNRFGCINLPNDYNRCFRKGKVYGKQYSEHQLVYLYHYGYIPKRIHHLNKNLTDNRVENLVELVV